MKSFIWVCVCTWVDSCVYECIHLHVEARGQLQVLFLWCHVAFFLVGMCSWRFVCTCACMHSGCACMHAGCACIHVLVHAQARDYNAFLSCSLPYTFWDRDFYWTWSSPVHLGWLSSKVQGLPTPPPPQCQGYTCMTTCPAFYVLHTPLSSSVFV